MHEWFTRPLRFGDPQPPWEEIWEAADTRTELCVYERSAWRFRGIYDAVTGKKYTSTKAFLNDVGEDGMAFPFAMVDGEPDFDHALEMERHFQACPECDGTGKVFVTGRMMVSEAAL